MLCVRAVNTLLSFVLSSRLYRSTIGKVSLLTYRIVLFIRTRTAHTGENTSERDYLAPVCLSVARSPPFMPSPSGPRYTSHCLFSLFYHRCYCVRTYYHCRPYYHRRILSDVFVARASAHVYFVRTGNTYILVYLHHIHNKRIK